LHEHITTPLLAYLVNSLYTESTPNLGLGLLAEEYVTPSP
jgi:hypothetical protein